MDAPQIESRVLTEVWKAKIPIRLKLKHCSVPDAPLPFYAELPRFAYLPFLFHDTIQFFARSTVEAVKHKLVFECEGVILPWNIPVGVLYDLLAQDQIPWCLEVSFVSAFPCDLLPWDDDDEGNLIPLKKLYKQNLKEAAYMLKGSEGSNAIYTMELESANALWQSSQTMDVSSCEACLSGLNFSTEDSDTGVVPVRIFLQKGRQVLRWKDDVLHLSRPVDMDATLLEMFQKFFPNISWNEPTRSVSSRLSVEDITNENAFVYLERPIVKMCSMMPDLEKSRFGWLHRSMHAPDHFLYIVITPKEQPCGGSLTDEHGS